MFRNITQFGCWLAGPSWPGIVGKRGDCIGYKRGVRGLGRAAWARMHSYFLSHAPPSSASRPIPHVRTTLWLFDMVTLTPFVATEFRSAPLVAPPIHHACPLLPNLYQSNPQHRAARRASAHPSQLRNHQTTTRIHPSANPTRPSLSRSVSYPLTPTPTPTRTQTKPHPPHTP